MFYLYKIIDLNNKWLRRIALSMAFALTLFLQSCFENNEFFINFEATDNIPMNIVLPLIYEGAIPIKTEELQNEEKYTLLGNCKLSSTENNSQSQTSKADSSEDDKKQDEPSLSNDLSGTPIPLFIMPAPDYEDIPGNKVRQYVYIMPEVLAPGEHYCLTVQPMYKETKDLSEVTQTFTYEFNTVGKKTSSADDYSGPKYSDPDLFELGFPMPYAKKEQDKDYLLPIYHQASQTFSPLFKFAKQGMPDDAFWADPRKIRDSIHVCEILKSPEIIESNDDPDSERERSKTTKKTECQPVNGIQVKMLEDLPQSEDGKYLLTNYAYFTVSGGALKLNTPYQIKVLYPFGDSKENISYSAQIHSFMLVDDEVIISALAPEMNSEEKEENQNATEPEETETSDTETQKQSDPTSEENVPQEDPSLNPKDVFYKFKREHGQEPGESYIEIPIRSLSSSTTNK